MNMGYVSSAILLLVGLLSGIGLGVIVRQYWFERRDKQLQVQSKNILTEAKKEAETIKKEAILQAKDSLFQMNWLGRSMMTGRKAKKTAVNELN